MRPLPLSTSIILLLALNLSCSPGEPRCPDDHGMIYMPEGLAWFRYEGERWEAEGKIDEQVRVDAFCIDRYEYPNKWGARPKAWIGWSEAKALCEQQGKRLCSGPEWQKAFGGPDGLRYPYGNEFDPEKCNTYIPGAPPVSREPGRSGWFRGCKSPYGVYDMGGNLSEWTDELWQEGHPDRVLRGGSFNWNPANHQQVDANGRWFFVAYSESIASIHHHAPPNDRWWDDGARCCADPISPHSEFRIPNSISVTSAHRRESGTAAYRILADQEL